MDGWCFVFGLGWWLLWVGRCWVILRLFFFFVVLCLVVDYL